MALDIWFVTEEFECGTTSAQTQAPAAVTVAITIKIDIENGFVTDGYEFACVAPEPVEAPATTTGIFTNLHGYCDYIIVGLAVRAVFVESKEERESEGVGDCFIIVCFCACIIMEKRQRKFDFLMVNLHFVVIFFVFVLFTSLDALSFVFIVFFRCFVFFFCHVF